MKTTIAIACGYLSVIAAAPVGAQTIDFRSAKCSEVAALPKPTVALISVWLDGFLTDEDDPESTNVDLTAATGADAEKLIEYCQQNPGAGLLQAAEAVNE